MTIEHLAISNRFQREIRRLGRERIDAIQERNRVLESEPDMARKNIEDFTVAKYVLDKIEWKEGFVPFD